VQGFDNKRFLIRRTRHHLAQFSVANGKKNLPSVQMISQNFIQLPSVTKKLCILNCKIKKYTPYLGYISKRLMLETLLANTFSEAKVAHGSYECGIHLLWVICK
jgi:hypothetical protein